MNDPIIACFKEEFDRFFAMVEQQIERCPDDLWGKKVGGFPFWQEQLHNLACIFYYARPEGPALFADLPFPKEVIMLAVEPSAAPPKDDLRRLAAQAKAVAYEYMAGLTGADLTGRHRLMSEAMQREVTHQTALIALSRHLCYHLGSGDAALRNMGLPGVY